MNNQIQSANIFYHGEGWAKAMAAQCALAVQSIHLSALSMLPPTPHAQGDWPELWRAWCAAAKRGVRVDIWLPAASPIHPATKGNRGAGNSIQLCDMHIHHVIGNRLLHAKTCVIDEQSIWIGSGNFTAAAAHHNYEAYLQATCPEIARQIVARWKAIA